MARAGASSVPVSKPARKPLRDRHGRRMPRQAHRDKFVREFFELVPRPNLEEALELSPDDRFRSLGLALTDPAFASRSIPALCRRFKITLTDLVDFWAEYEIALGTLRMLDHLPQVMEDLAIEARSRRVPCPECNGAGLKRRTPVCAMCFGKAEVRVPGDPRARLQLFEILRLTGRNRSLTAVWQNPVAPNLREGVKRIDRIVLEPPTQQVAETQCDEKGVAKL